MDNTPATKAENLLALLIQKHSKSAGSEAKETPSESQEDSKA